MSRSFLSPFYPPWYCCDDPPGGIYFNAFYGYPTAVPFRRAWSKYARV